MLNKMRLPFFSRVFLLFFFISFAAHLAFLQRDCPASSAQPSEAFAVMPWKVGQFVLYQVISFEGENAGDRYGISITGKEDVDGKEYFWIKIDIWERILVHGYNKINIQLKKNISFRALILPKNADYFARDPAGFISGGIFPAEALKLSVQIGDGQWYKVDPNDFFRHQDVIEDTPYSLTPHAKARIDFSKLEISDELQRVRVPAGLFSCFCFSVDTAENEDYWQEGFKLWRSPEVPILGMVKMEFSKTNYWNKFAYKKKLAKEKGNTFFMQIYNQRVAGRMRPDTCAVLLIDYGSK